MTKEELLKIDNYHDYDKRRNECRELDFTDPEIIKHVCSLYPKLEHSGYENGIITEAYKEKRR